MAVQNYLEFRSRVDRWVFGLILGTVVFGLLACLIVLVNGVVGPATRLAVCLVMTPLLLLLVWILFGTRYRLTNSNLQIQSGPLKKNIQLDTIISIEPVCNYQTGLALSRDRFRVRFNKFDTVEISPEDRGRFLKEISERATQLIWQEEKLVSLP